MNNLLAANDDDDDVRFACWRLVVNRSGVRLELTLDNSVKQKIAAILHGLQFALCFKTVIR